MRKVFVLGLTFVFATMVMRAGLLAAAPAQQQPAGAIQGIARNAQQQTLPGVRVQVRARTASSWPAGPRTSSGVVLVRGAQLRHVHD